MNYQQFGSMVWNMVVYGSAFMAVAYALAYCNKLASDWRSRQHGFDIDDEIEEKSNLAVGIRRFGLYIGIGIGMFGVIIGPSAGFLTDMVNIALYGAFVSVLFLAARSFNDYVILPGINNTEAIVEGNLAVALVECGAYLATGVIAMASVQGEGGGIYTSIAFFILGQLLLLGVVRMYELTSAWGVIKEIRTGNTAAGILLGGTMFALSIAIHGAVAIDFVNWTFNLTILAVEGTIAIVFMWILSLVIDRFFLPGTDIQTEVERDENVAAILVVVAMKVFGGLMITAAII